MFRDICFVVAYFAPARGEEEAEWGVEGDGFGGVEDDVEGVVEESYECVEGCGAEATEV